MILKIVNGTLPILITHEGIKTLLYDRAGNLTVIAPDDTIVIKFPTKLSPAYNAQYGTPISTDGKAVFIGTWEYGLFCYSLETGELLWKQKPGGVRRIIVCDDLLFIEMKGRGIYTRQAAAGELVNVIKMPAVNMVIPLRSQEVFVGTYKGKYSIHRLPSFEVIHQIEPGALNINNSLSFLLAHVYYEGDTLMITGIEQHKNGTYDNLKSTSFIRPVAL